jgi:hypothetical protein
VVIGDTPNDVRAALASGARAITVATGTSGEEALRDAGATTVLAGLDGGVDLAEIVCIPEEPEPERGGHRGAIARWESTND